MLSLVDNRCLEDAAHELKEFPRKAPEKTPRPTRGKETFRERVLHTQRLPVQHSRAPSLKKLPAAGGLACRVSDLVVRLGCLSKAHTIHIISIQIQNPSDYCVNAMLLKDFFSLKEHLSDMHF